jgi:Flp pilus assembly protein TadG
MDFLQAALIFLILLLSIFLGITGIQVFFILRDLKKALDRFNTILKTGENIAEDIEKPVAVASKLVTSAETEVAAGAANMLRKIIKPKSKRFYKKVL